MAPEVKSRKRKAGATSETATKKTKHVKGPKTTADDQEHKNPLPSVVSETKGKQDKHQQLNEKQQPVEEGIVAVVESQADSEVEEDDQTEALLKGFESSDDNDVSGDEGFEKGQEVPSLPANKKLQKKLKGAADSHDDSPGIIYVGRIPHGFYEHEMRAYFSQFGDIRRLRLSRNRKTGHSKHYAFIEFKSSEVAQIVADTMDNYLMFGHILKCKIVPKEQVHEKLWKGANKRFKKVPWNRLEGRALKMGKTREEWNKKIVAETKNRKEMQEKLKAIGYDFEPPVLKAVEDVPKQIETQPLLEDTDAADEGDQTAIAGSNSGKAGVSTADTIDEIVPLKKAAKKTKKTKVSSEPKPLPNEENAELESPTTSTTANQEKPRKSKKAKKTKKSVTGQAVADIA